MMFKTILYLILIIIISEFNLFSQNNNSIVATKITGKIKIDGILDEKEWEKIPKINNFTQREPKNGEPATERTEVAFCYDDEKLYIGIWCYDQNPSKIIRKGMRRDFENWRDDTFSLVLDPNNDKTSGYVFIVNSNGARRDGTLSKFGNVNYSWNGIWDVDAKLTNDGWFAEIEIPFSTLSFSDKNVQEWGINFKRDIRHKVEEVLWQGWSRNSNVTNLHNAGKIVFYEKIKGNQILEVKPYGLVGTELHPNSSPTNVGKVGGDANIAITQNVKLNLTLNTDFAQVESDELKVNLTRFSLYFPEKRDFFLESNNIFDFSLSEDGGSIFYSRRIGIKENRLVPIIAGAKLTGRIANTTFGIISLQNDKQDDNPTTNNSVVRLEQSIGENIKFGGIFTSLVNNQHSNFVYGADFNYSTNEFLGDKNLVLAGRLARTNTSDLSNTNNNAIALGIIYPNNLIETSLMYTQIQKDFNAELGFINRTNYQNLNYNLELRPRIDGELIRNFFIRPISINSYWTNETNELESMNISLTPIGIAFTSGDFISIQFTRKYDRLDEGFKINENFEFLPGDYWFNSYSIEIDTYGGRPLTSWFWIQYGNYYDADYCNFYGFLAYNFNKNLNMNISYSIDKLNKNNVEFLDKKITTRVDFSINPKLSSSVYAQYSDFFEAFLINLRINWIPVVGSDVYFVINQSISRNNPNWTIENTTILSKFVWRIPVI